jgi:hypothetical protein
MIGDMDDNLLPADLADRPRTQESGLPVPFACEDEDGGFDVRSLSKRRTIRCALSRICGLCGTSLGWPVAFLGSEQEADDNALHFPPLHEPCAEAALHVYLPLGEGALGIDVPPQEWVLVTTGGFEIERPADRRGDQRVVFHPNSVVERRTSTSR